MISAMTGRSPLPEPLARGPFTVAQAGRLGVPLSRLRARDLSTPFRGVRAHGDPAAMSIEDLANAYAPLLGPTQFFSHTTAAAIIGMRMPTAFTEDVLHVSTIAPHRAPRTKGVVGHQWTSPPVVWGDGLVKVSSAVETWISLADALPVTDLVVMGDGLVRRKEPFTTSQDLRAQVESPGRMRGRSQLREALGSMRAGTDSAPETQLRLLLTSAGCPGPEVNGEISTSRGLLHGDLVYRRERVVVEYDGEQHRLDDRQFGVDLERLDSMMAVGWRVVRVDKHLLRQRDELTQRVRQALAGG